MKTPRARRILAAIAAVLAVLVVTIVVTDDTAPDGSHHRTVTVRLGGAQEAGSGSSPSALRVPAAAVALAATGDAKTHAGNARDETPVGVPATVLEQGREAQEKAAADDQLPIVAPDAAPSQAGCRSRFISSYSSRRGVAPRWIVLHYTVSPNTTGWGDVDGVTAFFARPATQASSNYVVDGEGHCNYIVREVDKAWAQAAANPWAISIEVINSGHEASYIAAPGLRTLGRVVHDAAKRWQIPLQAGGVSGCSPSRAGVVTHHMLGPCGGGHVDVTPYPEATVVGQVLAAARTFDAPAAPTATHQDRVTCGKLNAWRKAGRPHGGAWERRSIRRRHALDARHVTCTTHGPVRR